MTVADWNRRYDDAQRRGASVWSTGPNALVAELLADVPPGTAVDLGAGEGRNALWLARRGWTVTAVDFSETGLRRGRDAAEADGLTIEWVCADATTWQPPQPVDLVLVAYLQLPSAVLGPLLRALPGWLAPGGRLLVLGHDRDNLVRGVGGPPDPDVLHSVDQLAQATDGLDVQRCAQVTRTVATPEGERAAIDTLLWARRLA
ncbi:class I SAM-dependent methyltransferase [Pseudonocardia asaccharolytica]|uniref:Methyltransferase domain-containing protein n=1 Tax=Pseudonocardia asaccharolytica DSM 44247 = NBRC 16224 TaxID=1123024 RepID=A0A511D0K6_9PSEU|nr:class I SAM-dependent methyltransferase [Pseudonocardia asaccharolytica]GEL18311.1 hypothetical protein PA7_21480 [Pseudonocardia asaccharolytica DSM 44247 = NBRC 16224]